MKRRGLFARLDNRVLGAPEPSAVRPKRQYVFAVLMAAGGAFGTQVAQVIDGQSLTQALGAFLVLWLLGALVLVPLVALLLRRQGKGL
jgi:hypothetical protein